MKKLKKLVLNRENIANKLTETINSFDGINAPLVREDCRHVYYVWAAKIDLTRYGLTRKIISKALQMEGLPIEEGYVKPLYFLPAFQRKIAIGKGGWPFSLTDINYFPGMCPVAENIYKESLLELCICSYELSKKDLEGVILGFNKVFKNLNTLKNHKLENFD